MSRISLPSSRTPRARSCATISYCALHESAQSYPALHCGFVHVPYLPEQAKDGNAPSMSLALMTKALEIAAEVIVEA